ncbi:MAG TPA: hypothetical protein VHB73_00925 [Alphaproteobacteria bacterium]|nr:hypothetical protein [Alphaproteobacteria bacterium]
MKTYSAPAAAPSSHAYGELKKYKPVFESAGDAEQAEIMMTEGNRSPSDAKRIVQRRRRPPEPRM